MLKLLESGKFEIAYSDRILTGQFNVASLRRFSLEHGGLDFTQTINFLTENPSISSLVSFIKSAIHQKTDEWDVLEALESIGGIGSDECTNLISHFLDGFIVKKKATGQVM